ncbi:hypothetical protein dsx2_2203 [Desulfovibrio sp. X2]|uniref:hypothetical protein n=1 Tax=Desulfovibrio sp. X2 TaxID=941449 RepID=UPI0003589EC0|nr:hypothetical protein [Desulfovibrio sp. X2]EPR43586.1 hypothetical protein dsx2_2203 [Desulfovibrio sp. X2]
MDWSSEVPTEPGVYWFEGVYYADGERRRTPNPTPVVLTANGFAPYGGGEPMTGLSGSFQGPMPGSNRKAG